MNLDPADISKIGNTVTLKVNGRRWICQADVLGIETVPGNMSESGSPEDAVSTQAYCLCGVAAAGGPQELRWLTFVTPIGFPGLVTIQGRTHRLVWGVDPGTWTDITDDELYVVTVPSDALYGGALDRVGAPASIETTTALVISHWDPSTGSVDTTRNLILDGLRLVGAIERDCRPGRC